MSDTHFNAFVRGFSNQEMDNVVKIGRNYFLTTQDLINIKENVNKDIFSMGIFMGEHKDRFYPSPACVDIISSLSDATARKIMVNKKAEWLFLCGRNILMESVTKNPHSITEGLVLVQNERNENLGYGLFRKEGKDLVVRNLLDKGKYLRMNEKGRR